MQLNLLYKTSDAFISPTYETDMQMGVLEAMASGLPVISREAEWLPESVTQFKHNTDLQRKIYSMANSLPSYRAEKAQNGLKEVEQYSFTHIAEKAVKIYAELLLYNNRGASE